MSDKLDLARHYLLSGNPERAWNAVNEIEDDSSRHVDAWKIRAAAALGMNRESDALDSANAGLQLEPDSTDLVSLRAYAEMELGRLRDAERDVLVCLEAEPDDPGLLCLYSDIVARAGQIPKAEALLERAAAIEGESQSVLLGRANLAYVKGDKRGLEQAAAAMLAADPASRTSHHVGGMAMATSGKFHAAARHYSEAAGLDPTRDDSAEIARDMKAVAHPLLYPLWPIMRFGPWVTWGGFIVLFFVLRSVAPAAAGVVALLWIVFVIYSWVVPPIVERRLAR